MTPEPQAASAAIDQREFVDRHRRMSSGIIVADLDFPTAPGKGKLPAAALHAWIAQGIESPQTLADLCLADYGVRTTRQGVSHWRKVNGYDMRVRTASAAALIPWRVSPQHVDDRRLRMLRTAARKREGLPVQRPDQRRHAAVQLEMNGFSGEIVIAYDQEAGFCYTRRRQGIDLDLIADPRILDDGSPRADTSLLWPAHPAEDSV